MRPLHENLAGRLLHKLVDVLHLRPRWFFYLQLVLFLICAWFTATRLEVNTDRSELVSAKNRHQRNFLQFRREFRMRDNMVAIVESNNHEKNRAFIERLAARLQREPELFKSIFYKGDLKLMGPKGLLFLSEETLAELRKTMGDYEPLIKAFSQADNLNSLFDIVNQQFRALAETNAHPTSAKALATALPALERVVNQASESVQQPVILPSPGISALFGNGQVEGRGLYLTFAGGRIYMVVAQATSEGMEPAAIKRMRQLVKETQQEIPGVNTGITGEPVLTQDETLQARRDSDVAAVISLVLSAVIFIYGYHELRRPLLATVCLLVGIAYALGFATYSVGKLNLLSLTLVPILIGLSIDFAVHLIARYEEELRRGHSPEGAIRKALVYTGLGIFTSGFTTAGAFFAMMLTDFKGIREMGLISGVGLLVCLIPMMTMLPIMLVRGRQVIPDWRRLNRGGMGWREKFEQAYLKRPKLILIGGAIFTIFTITQIPRVQFDYNLLNLQTRDLPAVGMEMKLIESGSQSLLYCAVIADSLERAVKLEEQIKQLPTVESVTSVAKYLTENQEHKLALVRQLKSEFAEIPLPPLDTKPVDMRRLTPTLSSLQGLTTLAIMGLGKDQTNATLVQQLRSLRDSVDELRRLMVEPTEAVVARLTAYQQGLFRDLNETVSIVREQDTRGRMEVQDLPRFLQEGFIGRSGRYLLQVYPKDDIWQRDAQEKFVQELRTVDPEVTGSPVQFYEYTSMLKVSFQKAAGYAAAAIALLVLLHFRSIASVLLAFLPVGLGFCWMLGLMGAFGIPFNPVNIMSLTLVIGIGVTNGIHILNRFAEEENPSILGRSTGKAVLVSALTTMAGFGSLMVAKHQGIASLGQAMVLGTGMCMIASLAFLPAVLNLLSCVGWKLTPKRKREKEGESEHPPT